MTAENDVMDVIAPPLGTPQTEGSLRVVGDRPINHRRSSYLQYLPAILRADPLVGQFLLAFERILSGLPPDPADPMPQQPGLEEYLDRIATYFAPHPISSNKATDSQQTKQAPAEFLPWLSGWVALSLRDDWDEEVKRRFISQIVPLYRLRGTKTGMKKLLELYTSEEVTIYEFAHLPHYFQVQMTLSATDATILQQKYRIAIAILNQEKPAHTYYSLQIIVPTMQIRNDPEESRLRVGRNTILGTASLSKKSNS